MRSFWSSQPTLWSSRGQGRGRRSNHSGARGDENALEMALRDVLILFHFLRSSRCRLSLFVGALSLCLLL